MVKRLTSKLLDNTDLDSLVHLLLIRVALGCLHAGISQTHINNVLSTLNAPTLNCVTFNLREREVGKAVEGIEKSSFQDFLNMERKEALQNGVQVDESNLVPMPCSFNMGWQKRGKGHNSRTGQAAVMSLTSGKVQAPVVQRPDNFIRWIRHYSVSKLCFTLNVVQGFSSLPNLTVVGVCIFACTRRNTEIFAQIETVG